MKEIIINSSMAFCQSVPKNYTENTKLTQQGVEVSDERFDLSDFVEIDKTKDVAFYGGPKVPDIGTGTNMNIGFYDENKNFLDYWGLSGEERTVSAAEIEQYAPTAKYVRMSFNKNSTDVYIKQDNTTIWERNI